MKLMIVESPGKTKKIESFLGSDWKVMASVGHVRDLPLNDMGVSAPDFKPKYEATERGADVLSRLAGAVKNADEVYLATDPDREGEAIAWHLQDALKLKNPKRVTFSEITEKAVKAAIEKAGQIDMKLVAAQEGRRVLDRFCGYMVSQPLSRAAGTKLSAGRVQSLTVRIVVERERDINNFKSTTHYGVELTFEAVNNITDGWKATWLSKPWLEDGQEYLLDKSLAEKISKIRTLTVTNCQEFESRLAPPAPFTTSSLQQAANNALKFTPKKTMETAQKLYEQGHISYMRTDSPNLSEDFVIEARAFCTAQGWALVDKPRTWKSKEGAQEAHEAVRPTHIEVEEAGETADEKALYQLIRIRTLACQLEDAVFAVRVILLESDMDDKKAQFEARGRTMLRQGWKILMAGDQTEDPEETAEPENPVPSLISGSQAVALEGKLLTKKTKPPKRFTEASLVKELERLGIGRPSTYAAILDNIMGRDYVKSDKRFLIPTERGEAVLDNLKSNFSFVNYDFTKKMEDALDDIATGKTDYKTVMASAHQQLLKEVDAFVKSTATPCPECQSLNLRHLVKKATKQDTKEYDFFACPDCDSTFSNVAGKPGSKQEKKEKAPLSEFKCKEKGCGKQLARRQGQKKDGSGSYDFYGCSGFPKCKASYQTKEDGTPDYEKVKK